MRDKNPSKRNGTCEPFDLWHSRGNTGGQHTNGLGKNRYNLKIYIKDPCRLMYQFGILNIQKQREIVLTCKLFPIGFHRSLTKRLGSGQEV